MTGPGHAEEEAFQREAEEKAVAGQAGAEARSVREPEEGAGLGLPHIWKEGCARLTSGRLGPLSLGTFRWLPGARAGKRDPWSQQTWPLLFMGPQTMERQMFTDLFTSQQMGKNR